MSTTLNGHAEAVGLVADFEAKGFRFSLDGDRLFVTPRNRLTDEQVEAIRAVKPAILEHLRGDGEKPRKAEDKPTDDGLNVYTPDLSSLIYAIHHQTIQITEAIERIGSASTPADDIERAVSSGVGGALFDLTERLQYLDDPIGLGKLTASVDGLQRDLYESGDSLAGSIGESIASQRRELEIALVREFQRIDTTIETLADTIRDGFAAVAAAIRENKDQSPPVDPIAVGMHTAMVREQGHPTPPKKKGGKS